MIRCTEGNKADPTLVGDRTRGLVLFCLPWCAFRRPAINGGLTFPRPSPGWTSPMRGASEAPGTPTRTNFGTMGARAPNGGRFYSNKVSGTAALVPPAFPGPTGPDSMEEDRRRNPERMAHNKVADLHRYGRAHPGRRQCGSVAMAHPIRTRPNLLDCNLGLSRETVPLAYWTVLHSYAPRIGLRALVHTVANDRRETHVRRANPDQTPHPLWHRRLAGQASRTNRGGIGWPDRAV